jgi:hypothetical protein
VTKKHCEFFRRPVEDAIRVSRTMKDSGERKEDKSFLFNLENRFRAAVAAAELKIFDRQISIRMKTGR